MASSELAAEEGEVGDGMGLDIEMSESVSWEGVGEGMSLRGLFMYEALSCCCMSVSLGVFVARALEAWRVWGGIFFVVLDLVVDELGLMCCSGVCMCVISIPNRRRRSSFDPSLCLGFAGWCFANMFHCSLWKYDEKKRREDESVLDILLCLGSRVKSWNVL